MVGSFRTGLASLVTLLVLSLSMAEMPHLSAGHHDVDFDLVVVVHDGSAHKVGNGGSPIEAGADHCLACHWGRAFRPGVESSGIDSPVVEARTARILEQSFVPARAPVAQPPLRSPPHAPVPS
jgi:hypothetical protein